LETEVDAAVAEPGGRRKLLGRWRLVVLAFVGALVVAGALVYRHYWLARPVGEGPAGPTVPRKPFRKPWTTRPILLLGIGDSITRGFGATEGHGYFDMLVANPSDERPDLADINLSMVFPNLQAENLAVSGSTSLQHIDVIRERLEARPADTLGIVVMTTGGNDLIHNYGRTPPREGAMYGATFNQAKPWIANFQTRLDEMLDLLDDRLPGGCHVFLADIYDPTDSVGDAPNAGLPAWPDGLAIHRAYNEIIHRAAAGRDNVHLVPIYREFLGHGIHCTQPWREHYRPEDPHYWYADNLEDPNNRGYDAIRRLFLLEMIQVADVFQQATPEGEETDN
jgi:hypothetical protein